MRIRRSGFTIVEVLAVTFMAAITLAAVYETLIVQDRANVNDPSAMGELAPARRALGLLEAELREAGTIGGSAVGGSDIAVASRDSVVFRAQRKIGFVCQRSRSGTSILAWSLGDRFVAGDRLLVFVDGDATRHEDDRWALATVAEASVALHAGCRERWPSMPLQELWIRDQDLTGVQPGSPVRSFEWVTYGLYRFDEVGWGLGRHTGDDSPELLLAGLAPPGRGLSLEYFDQDGNPTTRGSDVARMRIGMSMDPVEPAAEPVRLSTNLFLRNN